MSNEEAKKKHPHEHDVTKPQDHVSFYNSYGPGGGYASPNSIPEHEDEPPQAPAPDGSQPGSGMNPPNPQ